MFIDRIMHKQVSLGSHSADGYALLANFSTISNLLIGLTIALTIIFGTLIPFIPYDKYILVRLLVLGASFDATGS